MTRICRFLPLVILALFSLQLASAQSSVDFAVGFGSAQDKATAGLDLNTYDVCTSSTSSANCAKTPSLGSFFMGIGGNLMLWKHFGIGADVNFQPGKQDYAVLQAASSGVTGYNLQSRTTFYDFNGVFQPVSSKKAALQVVGGFGGANVKFYESASLSSTLLGNYNSSSYIQSSNHVQLHGGVGVQIYLTDHWFVRPQFDYHYVRNFAQFGSNNVTAETVWLGYSFGNR